MYGYKIIHLLEWDATQCSQIENYMYAYSIEFLRTKYNENNALLKRQLSSIVVSKVYLHIMKKKKRFLRIITYRMAFLSFMQATKGICFKISY